MLFSLFSLVMTCFLTTSCGYQVGSMMHPQIQSIAVADVKNDTKEPYVSSVMRGNLAEQFQVDGSLKLTSLGKADCIVYCRVLRVETSAIRWDSQDDDQTYRPSEFAINVTVEFTVLIPGRSEPLIRTRQITGSANYQSTADPNVGKIYGLRQACYNAARRIVQYTTEAW